VCAGVNNYRHGCRSFIPLDVCASFVRVYSRCRPFPPSAKVIYLINCTLARTRAYAQSFTQYKYTHVLSVSSSAVVLSSWRHGLGPIYALGLLYAAERLFSKRLLYACVCVFPEISLYSFFPPSLGPFVIPIARTGASSYSPPPAPWWLPYISSKRATRD
jgi:hypothetical protein